MRWFVFLMVALGSFAIAAAAESDVRVLSYNVRYGTAKDGANHWDKRREWLADTIRGLKPDLLGTQETLGFQRDYLAEQLPEFAHFGVGRDDGKEQGEMMALFYRRDRYEKLDGGHFWLSETPDKIGSKSWDSSLPRMVTWVKLRDRRARDLPPILFLNTHFDHLGETARVESSKLIRRKLAELAKDAAVIVTGDFNAGEDSGPYRALFAADEDGPKLRDVYRVAHPEHAQDEGTFSGFKAATVTGARIDWIAITPHWKVLSAAIDRTEKDGRTPSDHFAVSAELRR